MINIFCLFFTVAVFWFDLAKGHGRCTLEVGVENFRKMPLAYKIDGNENAILIHPEPDRHFTVDSDSKIMFSCVNTSFKSKDFFRMRDIQVVCIGGTNFLYDGNIYPYSHFICKDILQSVTKTYNQVCQRPYGNTVLDVGYQTENYFFTVYSVCFDSTNMNTLFTWYKTQIPFYDVCQNRLSRITFFKDATFKTLNLNTIYGTAKQINTINSILMLKGSTNQYMDEKYHYLSKGHLTSKTDFYSAHEQAATFNYLNIFPQWNHANKLWSRVEYAVRTVIGNDRDSNHVVVSGVYGYFTLPNRNRNQQPLYLASSKNQVWVPMFQWKLVYNAVNRSNSIVYIGYNNPRDVIPSDVRARINCKRIPCRGAMSVDKSLMLYCCDITSFQTAYGKIPNDVFDVQQGVQPSPAA